MGLTHDMLAEVQWRLLFEPIVSETRIRLERIEAYLIRRYNRE